MRAPVIAKGIILHETELSLKFEQIIDGERNICWIPRAQCRRITKKSLANGTWEAEVELPEWIAEAKQLEVEA